MMLLGLRASVAQVVVMAAIVTTLLYVPLGALAAWASYALLGVSIYDFVSFGDRVHPAAGLLAWWWLAFLPALAYAVLARPGR
jgi:hypothetical protein